MFNVKYLHFTVFPHTVSVINIQETFWLNVCFLLNLGRFVLYYYFVLLFRFLSCFFKLCWTFIGLPFAITYQTCYPRELYCYTFASVKIYSTYRGSWELFLFRFCKCNYSLSLSGWILNDRVLMISRTISDFSWVFCLRVRSFETLAERALHVKRQNLKGEWQSKNPPSEIHVCSQVWFCSFAF